MHDSPASIRDIPVSVYIAAPAGIAGGRAAAWLDAQETARAGRFRFERDRETFVAAHGLLRGALSRHIAGTGPAAWRFTASPLGKPCIVRAPGMPDVRFSLSHTAGCVAVALCEGRETGVDVERVTPATATIELAQSFCTAAELAGLAALERSPIQPDSAHGDCPTPMAERFFRLWTLKESVVKGLGQGLSRPLTCAGFSLDQPTFASLGFTRLGFAHLDEDLRRAGVWHVRSGLLASGHAFALTMLLRAGERPRLTAYAVSDPGALAASVAPAPLPLAVSSCSSHDSTVFRCGGWNIE